MAGLYDDRIVGLKEQKEFARRLREQQQEPAGQMVSGWYVPNTGGAVVNALRNVLGAYQERQADEELKGVERERAKDIANVYAQMGVQAPESLLRQAGTEEIKPGMIDRFTALLRGEEAKGTPAQLYQQPALTQNVSSDQYEAGLINLSSLSPDHAQLAGTLYNARQSRELAKAEKESQRNWDMYKLAKEQEFRSQENQANRDTRLEVAQLAQANKPERNVNIFDPQTGQAMLVPQSQVQQGQQLYTPQAAKQWQENKAKQIGKESFQNTLSYLADQYKNLKQYGGIQSEETPYANFTTVPLKRFTSGVLGNETKTAITNINQARSALLQDFKNATGMSASQMNSDRELQTAMNTLSDPSSTYESTQDALNFLSKKYGTGDLPVPERAAELEAQKSSNPIQTETKVLNGKTYQKINGEWHESN